MPVALFSVHFQQRLNKLTKSENLTKAFVTDILCRKQIQVIFILPLFSERDNGSVCWLCLLLLLHLIEFNFFTNHSLVKKIKFNCISCGFKTNKSNCFMNTIWKHQSETGDLTVTNLKIFQVAPWKLEEEWDRRPRRDLHVTEVREDLLTWKSEAKGRRRWIATEYTP